MIALTAAYDPGDKDAGTYTHVDVISAKVMPLKRHLKIVVCRGTLGSAELQAGTPSPWDLSNPTWKKSELGSGSAWMTDAWSTQK